MLVRHRERLNMVTFEQLVKACNAFIWHFMYSPPYGLEFASHQHRDLVRTFFAGAMEAYIAQDNAKQVQALVDEYAKITGEHWMPDNRFKPESTGN
jgi:hypothetical protein